MYLFTFEQTEAINTCEKHVSQESLWTVTPSSTEEQQLYSSF